MEREVGGGIGMGKTCKLKAVSFQCMTKFTTNEKKKKVVKVFYNYTDLQKLTKLLKMGEFYGMEVLYQES